VNAEIRKDQIYERKADSSGRISLPARQFAGKKLEIAVLDEVDDEE